MTPHTSCPQCTRPKPPSEFNVQGGICRSCAHNLARGRQPANRGSADFHQFTRRDPDHVKYGQGTRDAMESHIEDWEDIEFAISIV